MDRYLDLAGCAGRERQAALSVAPENYTATIGWYSRPASRCPHESRRASQPQSLAVVLGANVQQDQLVTVSATLGEEEMARGLAAAAYRHGERLRRRDVLRPVREACADRARARGDARLRSLAGTATGAGSLGRQRAARISLSGPAPPDASTASIPERAGRDQLPFIKQVLTVVNERLVNWTVVPSPTPRWARLVYPSLPTQMP